MRFWPMTKKQLLILYQREHEHYIGIDGIAWDLKWNFFPPWKKYIFQLITFHYGQNEIKLRFGHFWRKKAH